MRGGMCDVGIVLCLSRTSTILFNSITGARTDHYQSAKDTYMYFKFQLYVEDLSPPAVYGIRTNNLFVNNQFSQ